jgi:hypothetical protein
VEKSEGEGPQAQRSAGATTRDATQGIFRHLVFCRLFLGYYQCWDVSPGRSFDCHGRWDLFRSYALCDAEVREVD